MGRRKYIHSSSRRTHGWCWVGGLVNRRRETAATAGGAAGLGWRRRRRNSSPAATLRKQASAAVSPGSRHAARSETKTLRSRSRESRSGGHGGGDPAVARKTWPTPVVSRSTRGMYTLCGWRETHLNAKTTTRTPARLSSTAAAHLEQGRRTEVEDDDARELRWMGLDGRSKDGFSTPRQRFGRMGLAGDGQRPRRGEEQSGDGETDEREMEARYLFGARHAGNRLRSSAASRKQLRGSAALPSILCLLFSGCL